MKLKFFRWKVGILLAMVLVATIGLGCGVSSCSPTTKRADSKPTVAVSIPPLAYFVERIGGDSVAVVTLAPASADPETFEPSMAQMRSLGDSPLLLTTGLLPFEEKIAGTAGKGTAIVNLSDSIQIITGTHGDGDADPHIWTSLRNATIMARQVARALAEAFPRQADFFAANLARFDAELAAEDEALSRQLEPYRGRSFLVWHPSLSYFARDYGLNQIVLGEEHKELSIDQLRNRINQVKAQEAMVFFFQKEFDSRQAQIVTDATGLQPVEIAPLSPDIVATIHSAAEAIDR